MKYLIASDIHGSFDSVKRIIQIFKSEKCDKIILLGDIYYHGPRNPFPVEYNPMKVSEELNNIVDVLTVIKGNCDSEVDQMISKFVFKNKYTSVINSKTCFFTHGHKYNKDKIPNINFDLMFYGHFHIPFIKKIDNKIYINPGSISLPKESYERSYCIFDKNSITIKSIKNEIIERYLLD